MDSFVFPPDVLQLNDKTQLGPSLLPYFQMEPGYTNINHGSYGAPPRVVAQALRHYEDRMERCPDSWFRWESGPQVSRVIDELRKFIRVSDSTTEGKGVGDLVLVRNATFAMNSIFRAWPWKSGDKLFMLSEAYGMTKLAAKFIADSLGVQVVEVPMKFPITDNALVDLVTAELKKHGGAVKMAVFSHISSVPGAILPMQRLTELCRSQNVVTVIDGAHALGQLDLDMTALDPDYYIANGHKWLMTAKGAAFLYVKKKLRDHLHSCVITYGYGDPDAKAEFLWEGTADYSAWMTFSTAMKFRALLGEARIRDYCRKLSLDAGKLMAEIWKTEVLITDENQLGSMNNVRLPLGDPKPPDPAKFVERLVKELYLQYNTYMAYFQQDGNWYARISAQIYNDINDFKMVAEAVLKIKSQIKGQDNDWIMLPEQVDKKLNVCDC